MYPVVGYHRDAGGAAGPGAEADVGRHDHQVEAGVQFNIFELWALRWAKFKAKFSTRALQVKTYLKSPNVTWAKKNVY